MDENDDEEDECVDDVAGVAEEETEEEYNKQCHRALHENLCRNKMLQYFAEMRQTEEIFEAMLWDNNFRETLY